MIASTYGSVEGDAPKSYRVSLAGKIALALIACSAVVAIAHPGTRQATVSFAMDNGYNGLGNGHSRAMGQYSGMGTDRNSFRSADGGTPVASTTIEDQVQDLQDRVAAIEKYLQATSESGGSGTSRGTVMMPVVLGMMARGHGARRRLKDHDSGGSDNSRVLDSYGQISNLYNGDGNRDGAAPVTTTTIVDQVQDLQARVAAIEKYLQAASTSSGSASRAKAAAGF